MNILTKLLAVSLLVPTLASAKDGVEIPMALECFDYHGGTALEEGFGELPFVEGNGDINIGNNKNAPIKFELYVNPDSHSWTIMYVLGDLHCVAAGGEGTFRPAGIPEDGIRM